MGGYPNHVESLKRVVFKETAEPCRWRSETRNLNSGLKQLMKITTASLRGGWVPKTSWSFFYWQPAPRWRLHQWLEKPDKLASHEPRRSCGGPLSRDGTERRAHGPLTRALYCPLPTAPNDHRAELDHANNLDHYNLPTATRP